jgi:hypothetical protein
MEIQVTRNAHGYQAGDKCRCGNEKIVQLPAKLANHENPAKPLPIEILAGAKCGAKYGKAGA